MKLIIGLGNPGKKYENTRHNIGFIILDRFCKEQSVVLSYEKKFDAIIGEKNVSGEKIIFIFPQTFMNLSGKSVSLIKKFYNVKDNDLLVIHDDIDQDFGKIKCKVKSSHGGQNGMRSIISLTGTSEVPRIKIGIGRSPKMPVDKWVLSRFTKDDIKEINDLYPKVENILLKFYEVDFLKAING